MSITLSFFEPPPAVKKPVSLAMLREPKRWPRVARLVMWVGIAIAGLSAARFGMVRGWIRPIRVEGGSMAESLCGDHLRSTCRDCGYVLRCDVDSIPGDGELLCPNCGFPGNSEPDAQPTRGERVLVDSFPAALNRLRRWDLLAVSHFGEESGPVVKRLVALPGEAWEIRQGDLYINGRIEAKSLAQLRPLMLTVNDDRFRPISQQAASRWRSTARNSAWKDQKGRFRYEPEVASAPDNLDWLTYHHQRGLGATPGSQRATTVKDMDAYNQAESRTLFPVNDLGASFRVQLDRPTTLDLAITGHEGRLTCSLRIADGRLVLTDENEELADQPLAWHDWRRPTQVEFGICDQQFLVGIDGHEMLREALAPQPLLPTSEPIAIRVAAAGSLVSQLVVWRDIHYLDPRGNSTDWRPSGPLADDAIAILGDNPPVSIDSRHTAAPVRRSDVWGHVCRPYRA